MKYYLIVDNGTQWFTKALALNDSDAVHEVFDIDIGIKSPFMQSIFERETHFTNRLFIDNHYYGWTISKMEYDRLKKMVELYPKHKEYLETI